jgi:hypothetical protein
VFTATAESNVNQFRRLKGERGRKERKETGEE